MSESDRVIVGRARSEEQQRVLEQIAQVDECPFCPEALGRYHTKPILKEGEWWLLTESRWPYEHVQPHLLLISKQHAERLGDLPSEAGQEMLALFQWAEQEFVLASGALFVRFGDPAWNGGSVNHLHAHLIAGDREDVDWDKIKVKLGTRP